MWSPAPHAVHQESWGPEQEPQKPAAEEATEITTMETLKKKKGALLGPMALPKPGPVFGLQDTPLCSGSSAGGSALQLGTAMGLGKSSQSQGGKVLSWRSEVLVQPLSCPAQTGVWHPLGQSFVSSLLWELLHFSPLTAVYRETLGDMGELGLNPLSKPGKREIWAQVCPTRLLEGAGVPKERVWCSSPRSPVLLSIPSAVFMAIGLTV